jgi:hypothetical protein
MKDKKGRYALIESWDENNPNVTKVKVYIGDYVSFKSDYEQSGKIIDIKGCGNGVELTLFREGGFGGEYLRYSQKAYAYANECWLER